MRHITILAIVLFISISANAAVQIAVDNDTVPIGGTTNVSIVSNSVLNESFYGFIGVLDGEPGLLTGGDPIVQYPIIMIYPPPFDTPGFSSVVWFFYDGFELVPPGTLIDGITFECTGIGNVNLQLWSYDGDVTLMNLDNQVIHQQIPEPATILLLGIGGLLLNHRK